jgi:flagellar biosynthesis anti-sigma factor FlgM
MTSSIGSVSQNPATNEVDGKPVASAGPPPQKQAQTGAAAASEAVTVSDGARLSTDLLNAARNSDGVDHGAVQALRSAIQNGSYNVSPEDLAGAIINAVKPKST